MDNQKKNKIIISLLIVIIIILSVLCILFATGTIEFKHKNIDNNVQQDNDKVNEPEENFDVNQYIVLEDVVFSYKNSDKTVTTKKVKFQNIDDSLTKEFHKQQEEIINNIVVPDEGIFNAEYKLKHFYNNGILSIIYTIETTYAIGTCATKMAVTNIDLKNNRVISEEELLSKVGLSYNSIVDKTYEEELASWKKLNERNGTEISYYEVTFADFRDNKAKYVSEGMKKIPDIIYTYIEDGQIKYDYYSITLDTLFHDVGKGGCFLWKTVTLGEYK